ncbi:hypothetical protein OM427_07725 [Halomonas sp. 18H]|nr:hypothetical protein [Halomonas sp. 18H]MCW4149421.1 hypothetical protein [Halomonas sp. 18H]
MSELSASVMKAVYSPNNVAFEYDMSLSSGPASIKKSADPEEPTLYARISRRLAMDHQRAGGHQARRRSA